MRSSILTSIFCILTISGAFPQTGSLDPDFGNNGIVITDLGFTDQFGQDLLVQPDGKLIVIGFSDIQKGSCPLDMDVTLVRYLPNGSRDTEFGTDGVASVNYAVNFEGCPGDDFGLAGALLPDGKIIVTGQGVNCGCFEGCCIGEWLIARFLPDGELDDAFGEGGILIIPTPGTNAVGQAILLLPEGKLLFAGGLFNGADQDIALVQLNADGSLDESFGNAGLVITDFGGSSEGAFSAALQPDGKILAAGFTDNEIALVRYLPDGSLDATFGEGGRATADILGPEERANDVVLQPDGKILVAGFVNRPLMCAGTGCIQEFAVIRYLADGSLDTTFGLDHPYHDQPGVVYTPLGIESLGGPANALVLQPDGKILAAGFQSVLGIGGPSGNFALVRYHPDGTPDETFDDQSILTPPGVVITDIPTTYDYLNALALQPDGKIVVAGFTTGGGPQGFNLMLARYFSGLSVGTQEQSPVVNAAVVFPNPARSEIAVQYYLKEESTVTLQLLDEHGRVLGTLLSRETRKQGNNREQIRLPASLPPAFYLLSLQTPEDVAFLKLMVL